MLADGGTERVGNHGELLHAEVVLQSGGATARSRVATSVKAAQTLQFAATSNVNPVAIGELLELTWTATNMGAQPLSDVQLALVIPERMDIGVFNPGETFTRNVGTLAPGQSFSEVLPIRIRSGVNGPSSGEVMHMGLSATSALESAVTSVADPTYHAPKPCLRAV